MQPVNGLSLWRIRRMIADPDAHLKRLACYQAVLFEMVGSDTVKMVVNQTYALVDAAKAHQDLEGRTTSGSSVLLP